MAMDVRVYREKPTGKEPAKGTAQAVWKFLQENSVAGATDLLP